MTSRKYYDMELQKLNGALLEMGEMIRMAISGAVAALLEHDHDRARSIIAYDEEIDKQNRRKLLKAYSDKEPLAMMLYQPEETELAIRTSASRMLLVGTAQIAAKTTRDSQGVAVVTLKKNQTIASVVPADTLELANPHRYRVRSLPATGALIRAEDEGEQMSLL